MKSLIKIFVLASGITFMYSCDWFKDKPATVEKTDDPAKEVKIDTLQPDTSAKTEGQSDTGIVVKEEEKKKEEPK